MGEIGPSYCKTEKEMSAEEKQAMNTQEETSTPAPAVIIEAEQKAEPVVEVEKKDEKADQPASSSVTVNNETAPAKTTKSKKLCFPKPNITPKYYKDVEYQNRDKNNLHPNIKVNFSDVTAEPDGAHSFATIWGTSFKTYSLTKYWCYRILTAVLAVPLSVFWGLYFALLAFCSIWCIAPCIKGFIIWTNFISKIWDSDSCSFLILSCSSTLRASVSGSLGGMAAAVTYITLFYFLLVFPLEVVPVSQVQNTLPM